MTNGEKILDALHSAIDRLSEDRRLASALMAAARCEHFPPGVNLYGLWCDDCGECVTSEDESCNEERQLACIHRFLAREFSGVSYLGELLSGITYGEDADCHTSVRAGSQ